MSRTIQERYPNIADFLFNPTFVQPIVCGDGKTRVLSRWCNFWNMGARHHMIHSYTCVLCGVAVKKGRKTYRVCKKDLMRYLQLVEAGKMGHVYFHPLVGS